MDWTKIEFNFESNFGSSPWVQSMFCAMPIFMSLSISHLKYYDKLTQQEVIANVVRHATISFPEHTRKRACSGNKIGHMPFSANKTGTFI